MSSFGSRTPSLNSEKVLGGRHAPGRPSDQVQTLTFFSLFCSGFGVGFCSRSRGRCRFQPLFGLPSRLSFFECFALRFEFSERSGLRLSLRRNARVDNCLELHFLLSPRARGCFDIGLGAPLELGPSQHQASHRVWPTILRGGRIHPLDWAELRSAAAR